MAFSKMTKAERKALAERLEREAYQAFLAEFSAVHSFLDAQLLVARGPSPDTPGRRFYSNLAFFLGGFWVPHGSSVEERRLYIVFIERLEAAGALKDGVASGVLQALQKSIAENTSVRT